MHTKLDYLDDTYRFNHSAIVVGNERDERGGFLTFDRTIFYPQGGGQPSDRGVIEIADNTIPVTFVGFANGSVRHYIPNDYYSDSFVGMTVEQIVEKDTRLKAAKYHTAGHLISHVMETLNPELVPVKGYHFEHGAHIELIDENRTIDETLLGATNTKIAENIDDPLNIVAELSDFDTISKVRPILAPFTPKDKPTRIVKIGGYDFLPCGGTHVKTTKELAGLQITKIKRKKDNIKVSYSI